MLIKALLHLLDSIIMIKQTIFFISIIIFGVVAANAQQQDAKWSVGVYTGITNYRGDLSRNFYDPNDQILNIFDNTDFLSYGLSIGKSLSDSWSLRLMASRGEFIANDRGVDWNNELVTDSENFTRSLNVRTEINDLSLLGIWSLANDKILPEQVFLAPYFLFGGGFSTYKNFGDLYARNGDRYYYWNDQTIRDVAQNESNSGNIIQQDGNFETELSPLETEGVDYETRFIHATVGVGLKFRLWKRMSLNIESLFRFTNTDYLDDVRGNFINNYNSPEQAYAANPALRESLNRGNTDDKKDRLHFTTVSLHYNFGKTPRPFIAPAILIGDLYDTDKFQKTNTLPSSTDTTYQPISVLPVIDLDDLDITYDESDIEELEIPEIDMSNDDTLSVVNDFPEGIDTFYRVVTPMDSIFYTDELEIDAGLSDRVDTLTRIGDVLFNEYNNKWEPLDGEDWESYNEFLLASRLSDTTNFIVNNVSDTIQFPQANTGGGIDLTTTTDSLTETDLIAISNPVIEQPPLTIENTIVDTTEMQIIENVPMPAPPLIIENKKEKPLIISSDPRTDSLYWQVSQLSSNIAKLREEQKEDRSQNDAIVNQRLATVQAELDSLRASQARNNNELSEQWRADFQLAMTEIEKQIQTANNPAAATTNNNSQAEIDGMRREMESMRTYLMTTQQKNQDRSELEEYKRQLWLYEIQARNMKENTQEREKLESEIRGLKASIGQQQEAAIKVKPVTPAPVIIPVPANQQNQQEVNALKAEVTNLNNNMAEMRKLLEQQNTQNNAASTAELSAIKAEIAKISSSVNASSTASESAVISQLKAELAATRKQLEALNNTPAPPPPTIITNTVVPPSPTARDAIAGREKQLVFFNLGAAKLDAPSMQIIQSVAQLMNQYPEIYAELEGYTDSSGNADANLILSGKRATAVQNFLVQYGIPANRLIAIPRGEDPASNASYGRRVAIKLNIR